ncbi:ABC transporter substrate-binding protein [bacterium]|nr:ABC transporter substrate-binding protein [bacterium]
MAMDAEKVYKVLKETLRNFHGAARYAVMRHWRDLTPAQQVGVARALVLMEHVADDPARYFSRAQTAAAWRGRLARHGQVAWDDRDSRSVGPADVIEGQVNAAFTWALELRHRYYNFCRAIVDWEYGRTAADIQTRQNADAYIDGVRRVVEESRTWRVCHSVGTGR